MMNSEYNITIMDDLYWGFAWQQVQTFIVTHPRKKPQQIYLWVKDSYNIAFTKIDHFFDYMGFESLDKHVELERYDFADVFDYNVPQNPFRDFLISIVEGKYTEWEETAYDGRYVLKKDEE